MRDLFPERVAITLLIVALALGGLLCRVATAATPSLHDVRSFGAVGDGTTEDTVAFQAAVDRAGASGGTVVVPPGRYLIGSIYLPSRVTIAGTGRDSVLTLVVQPGPAGPMNRRRADFAGRTPFDPGHMFLPNDMRTVASVEGVEIRDLSLVGNGARQNGGGPAPATSMIHGIAILGGKGWVVRRVLIEDFDGDGIYLGGNTVFGAIDEGNGKIRFPRGEQPDTQPLAEGNLIEDSVVRRNYRNGMMIAHGDHNVIRRNVFDENQTGVACDPIPGPDKACTNPTGYPKYKWEAYESAELDLEPNRIKMVDGKVVSWQRVTHTLVENNVFRNSHRIGIQIVKGAAEISSNRIVDNLFENNRSGGIIVFAEGASYNTIEKNRFTWGADSVQRSVIRIHAGNGHCVVGNLFSGPQPANGHIVKLEPGTPFSFSRNTVFADNDLDVTMSSTASLVVFDRRLIDNHVSGNRLVDGGRIDVAPETVQPFDTKNSCPTRPTGNR